jgi:ribosomal protein L15
MTPWTSDQPIARPLPKHGTRQTQNKRIHTLNIHALSGFEPTIATSERVKTVHALDLAATVIGRIRFEEREILQNHQDVKFKIFKWE